MKKLTYQNETKERLDKFLASQFTDWSRNKIQRLIHKGQITVNGQTVVKHYWLKMNDEIVVKETKKQRNKETKKQINPEVIYKTDDYLILNKLAGLIVHPTAGINESTLIDWLKEKYPQVTKVGESPDRPGIVHRLDKEVSGVMVVALTQKMFEHLKKQFQAHQIKKEYLALVHGKIESDEGTINFPLKRSKISGKMVAKPKGNEAKEAITNFVVLKRFSRYSYLKITLKTGRTHQIRSHLQAYGYPILGDTLYRNKKIKENIKLDRIFLHSHLLGFYDLENKWQEYQADLPKELNNILSDLK